MIRRGGDDERRRLLATTDSLLERIEELRLADKIKIPDQLRSRVADVSAAMGQPQQRVPTTLAGAHDHVFRLQTRLLRAGSAPARQPAPEPSPASPSIGPSPVSLPERGSRTTAGWLEEIQLAVQRVYDRAQYLAAQVETARTLQPPIDQAVIAARRAQARDARRDHDDVSREVDRLVGLPIPIHPTPVLPKSGRFEVGDIVIDQDRQTVLKAGRPVRVTRMEREIMAVLAANPDRVLTREAIQHVVTQADPLLDVRSKVLSVHMTYLRSKLGRGYVDTVPGVGYRLSATPPRFQRQRDARQAQRDEQVRRSSRAQQSMPRSAEPPTNRRGSGR